MPIIFNGVDVAKVIFNGVECKDVFHNGVLVFVDQVIHDFVIVQSTEPVIRSGFQDNVTVPYGDVDPKEFNLESIGETTIVELWSQTANNVTVMRFSPIAQPFPSMRFFIESAPGSNEFLQFTANNFGDGSHVVSSVACAALVVANQGNTLKVFIEQDP